MAHLALVYPCGVHGAVAARDSEAVMAVLRGERTDANAAWWGFDPDNATAALQAAIRSGAATVVVPDMGRPWLVDPIVLEGDQEILLEKGVEIQARPGGFHGRSDMLMRLRDKSNVTIRGYGAVLRMRKEDYRRAPYVKSEFRACLAVYGGTNVRIEGITCASSGGDGIYIAGGMRPYSKDVVIKGVVADDNYRQGISVISVDGLLIEDTVLRGTEGTKPGAGIDFEPNKPTERLTGILLKNCLIEKNESYGIWVYTGNLTADSAPVDITISGGKVSDNGAGALFVQTRSARGALTVRSTRLDGKRSIKTSESFVVDIDAGSTAGGAR